MNTITPEFPWASLPDDENPEWTDAMFAQARRPGDLPATLKARLRGRPKAAFTKERTTIRLSPEVVAWFRQTGPGWQTRIDAALREWVSAQKAGS